MHAVEFSKTGAPFAGDSRYLRSRAAAEGLSERAVDDSALRLGPEDSRLTARDAVSTAAAGQCSSLRAAVRESSAPGPLAIRIARIPDGAG